MKINLMAKRIGAAFLGLALCASFAAATVQKASAKENNEQENKMSIGAKIGAMLGFGHKDNGENEDRKNVGMQAQVAIGVNGKVLVRGAKVTAISGNTISAQAAWGSFVSEWKVDASNAKFLHYSGGASVIGDVSVGDIISFTGAIDTSASNATVKADVVKDWSIDRDNNASHNGSLQGELKAKGGDDAPTTLTLDVKGKGSANDDSVTGDFTVNVAANTAILNKNWGKLDLGNFETGDTIRFYGLINSDNTANATVIRNVSR